MKVKNKTITKASFLLKSQVCLYSDSTFFPHFQRDISNVEVFNVQLPQVGELTELCWKLPDSRITAPTAREHGSVIHNNNKTFKAAKHPDDSDSFE